MKKILILIFTLIITCSASDFMKLSEFRELKNEAKPDTAIWAVNPIPDQLMDLSEIRNIGISAIFDWTPDTIYFNSVSVSIISLSEISPIRSANMNSDGDSLRVITTADTYGHARIKLTVDSNFGIVSGEFLVRVENPDYYWNPVSTQYNLVSENCIGDGYSEWKAASAFDLGNDVYDLNSIEFGYGMSGTADWAIVVFDSIPTADSILSGSKTVSGGYSNFIEGLNNSITGQIAVVFTSTANFMAMEPSGNSDLTWIYSESSGWEHPEDIAAYFAGAWYLRLLVHNTTTGIEEIITTEKSPTLMQNYPNPFNNQTVISWNLQNSGQVELNVFNSKGQLVKNLVNEAKNKGKHSVVFNADGMQTGIYFYQLKINGKIENTARMLYLK